jgi:hypothetical protein
MQRRRGPRLGKTQRGHPPTYDINSGDTWRPNPTLEPQHAVKLYQAMQAMGTSASAVVNKLLELMELDNTTGLPTWACDPNAPQQGTLYDMPAARPMDTAAA